MKHLILAGKWHSKFFCMHIPWELVSNNAEGNRYLLYVSLSHNFCAAWTYSWTESIPTLSTRHSCSIKSHARYIYPQRMSFSNNFPTTPQPKSLFSTHYDPSETKLYLRLCIYTHQSELMMFGWCVSCCSITIYLMILNYVNRTIIIHNLCAV